MNPAAGRPDLRVQFQAIDEQHHGGRREVCVPIQSQDVGVLLLPLEEQTQFAPSHISYTQIWKYIHCFMAVCFLSSYLKLIFHLNFLLPFPPPFEILG